MKKWIFVAVRATALVSSLSSTLWFGTLGVTSLAHASPELGQLRYLSEEYQPYNFSNDAGKPTGFSVELLQLVWRQTETPAQVITLLPWARAYYLLAQEPNVVLFSTARTQTRAPMFKWACPIGDADIVLMGLAARDIRLGKQEDGHQYRFGAVQSDVGEQLLLNGGIDEQRIAATSTLPQALDLLTSGKVDLLASNKTTLLALIHTRQLDSAQFKVAKVLSAEQFCFAFSQGVDDDLVKEFQQGLSQVLKHPEFQLLQTKYFPSR